jgi:NAD(P)-dependent dehydrogenase (short-subunit alcohol dehydrogenase family)
MSASPKVWFITGTSKGFGRVWARAALQRGDQVVATARDAGTLDELVEEHGDNVLALALDVTDKAAVDRAVATAVERFGRLDVVVNNAGYGQFGMIEELTEQEARDQFETNLFGALWVTQAVLPRLREQGSGHILQVSSVGGVNAFPTIGIYNASKWALEAMSQALAGEVAGLGIHVTIVEPGGFATDWAGPSAAHATPIAAYDGVRNVVRERFARLAGSPGDPEATGPAILQIVDADEPPLRFFLGRGPLELTRAEYAQRLATWEQWDEVSLEAHGHLEPAA